MLAETKQVAEEVASGECRRVRRLMVRLESFAALKMRRHDLHGSLGFCSREYVQRARLEVSRAQIGNHTPVAVMRRLAASVGGALCARLVDEIPELLLEERAMRDKFDIRHGTCVGHDALVASKTLQRRREARVQFALRGDEVTAKPRLQRFRGVEI